MAGYSDLRGDTDWKSFYEDLENRWACYGCSQPTRVVYVMKKGVVQPGRIFECPHNRFAPHAGSNRCPELTPIPGYSELWE